MKRKKSLLTAILFSILILPIHAIANESMSMEAEQIAQQMNMPINLNTASHGELITVSGIGAKTADAIIKYRTDKGPFATVDELKKIRGIGSKKLAKMRPHLSI